MSKVTSLAMGAVAALALMAGTADPANALALRFILDGGAPFDVVDGSAEDESGAANHVRFSGAIGGFLLGTTSSLSNSPGTSLASLGTNFHLTETGDVTSGSSTLMMLATETDFGVPNDTLNWNFRNSFSATQIDETVDGLVAEFAIYIDFGNQEFNTTEDADTFLLASGSLNGADFTGLFSDLENLIIPAGLNETPFSITQVLTLTHNFGDDMVESNLVNNTTVRAAPEPAVLGLVGLGLLGVAATRRRKVA